MCKTIQEVGFKIMSRKLNQTQQYALDIEHAVLQLFNSESELHKYELNKIDATKFFTAFVIAFNLLFNQLTQDDADLVESLNTMTRLMFQYLIENGTTKP
jgi:hypothetical protein